MSEEKTSGGTWATVIATAAVTVAVGVTAAALGGYLVPPGGRASEPIAAAGNVAQPTSPANGPSVVLVPVAPDVSSVAATEPEPVLTRYEEHERDEHRGRRHHERDERDDEEDEHDDD